jgi:hypothetical protein
LSACSIFSQTAATASLSTEKFAGGEISAAGISESCGASGPGSGKASGEIVGTLSAGAMISCNAAGAGLSGDWAIAVRVASDPLNAQHMTIDNRKNWDMTFSPVPGTRKPVLSEIPAATG